MLMLAAMTVPEFFGSLFTSVWPNPFFLAIVTTLLISVLLWKGQVPTSLILVFATIWFAIVFGFSNPSLGVAFSPISGQFFPVFLLVMLVGACVVGLALWYKLRQ